MMSGKHVMSVNQAEFQQAVIARSQQTPVLVDFWAPWCGPCRMLTPVLERLAQEFNGRFLLAKVNTDENPFISQQYGVRGIPNVKLFKGGKVVDEFVGAQPEPMVRQFLQRHVPAGPSPQQTRPQPKTPQDGNGRLQQARQLLRQGKGCEAQSLLTNFPAGSQSAEAAQLLPLAEFLCRAERGRPLSEQTELNAVYRQAAETLSREPSAALYHLLMALNSEPAQRRSQTKAIMQGLFTLLGDSNPLVQQYRQQLAMSGL